MGLLTCKPVYARHRHEQNCPTGSSQTGALAWAKVFGICASLILLLASAAQAEIIRVATYNVGLDRKGPGLLVRDLLAGKDPQIAAIMAVIAKVKPDILVLNAFDFDHGGVALGLFADQLAAKGAVYPHRFAYAPNSGLPSGADLDGDGRLNEPEDAQGFGWFSGNRGMAILSKFPFDADGAQNFSDLLWKDLSGAVLPVVNGKPWPSQQAWDVQRLSSKGHWDVPVILPDGTRLRLLVAHATPPVFDGPENQNGLRNRDEIRFWSLYLARLPPQSTFVILGGLNADPNDGEGSHGAINALLSDPRVRDVKPASKGGTAAAKAQGGANKLHLSDPAQDTVDWDESRTPGNMRVDYVLPSATLDIAGAGVFWPAPSEDGFDLVGSDGSLGSQHRLVWVDIIR